MPASYGYTTTVGINTLLRHIMGNGPSVCLLVDEVHERDADWLERFKSVFIKFVMLYKCKLKWCDCYLSGEFNKFNRDMSTNTDTKVAQSDDFGVLVLFFGHPVIKTRPLLFPGMFVFI